MVQEFTINAYLTLKLVDNATVIYIGGKKFMQCKYLLINVPINEMELLNDIESVDEVAEKLDHALEPRDDDDNASLKIFFFLIYFRYK